MDLRQIEYVVAVVDHGGFTRAADALGVAQPSLSQAVRRLEDDLRAPLFARLGRTVRLTDAGEAFLGPARQLLRLAAEARDAVASHAELRTGRLDVASLPTLVADPLADLVGTFRARHPSVTVRVADASTAPGLLEMVRDGRCEIALTDSAVVADDLEMVILGDQELVAVLPPGHPRPRGRLAIGALAVEPLVLTPPGTSVRVMVDNALAAIGASAVIAVETAQREAIVPLVISGAGVSVLPAPMAYAAEARGATIVGLEPRLWRGIGLVHRSRGLSPAARAFVDIAVAHPV